jgi:hypothetical protein
MSLSRALVRAAGLVVAATLVPLVGPLTAPAFAAGALPVGTVVTPGNVTSNPTTAADPGEWFATTEWPGLGSVAMDNLVNYASVDPAPTGLGAAVLATGPGDSAANHGGKPYLYFADDRYAGQGVTALSALTYQWTTVSAPQPFDRPYLSVEVADNANGSTGYMSWVYDPTWFGATNPAFGTWTAEDPIADTHGYWRPTRDVVDSNNNVVIPKNSSANWSDLVAAAPGKVILGISWFVGQNAFNANTVDVTAMVDDVTLDMSSDSLGTSTFDLEYALGNGDYTVDPATSRISLAGDVTTSQTAYVYDGYTVDGAGHTLTADSSPDAWVGAVLRNAGSSMNISDLTVTGQNLGGACDAGDNRLMGIYYQDAGGSVTNTSIDGITQGDGCQEGIAVYIKSTDPTPDAVTADHVSVTNYQKGGVTVTGQGADLTLTNSSIGPAGAPDGSSMSQQIAANGLQISFGATGTVHGTTVAGNEWDVDGNWSATAVLIYQAAGAVFTQNTVNGADTDEGVYVSGSDQVTVADNTIERTVSASDTLDLWGIGIDLGDGGNSNTLVADNYLNGWNINSLGLDPLPAPALTLASTKPGQITASWGSGIDHTEAGPASNYLVSISPGTTAHQVDGSADSTTFTGLSSTTAYQVTLQGRNPAFNTRNHLYLSNPGATPDVTASLAAAPQSSVRLRPAKIRFGSTGKVKGLVSASGIAVPGASVSVYAKPNGASRFRQVASTTTHGTGHWAVAVKPRYATSYYAIVTATGMQAAKTSTVKVGVKPTVTLVVKPRHPKVGGRATFKGRVKAAHSKVAGRSLLVQQRRHGQWHTVKSTTVTANGRYFTKVTIATAQRSRWRVLMRSSGYYEASSSHPATVKPRT